MRWIFAIAVLVALENAPAVQAADVRFVGTLIDLLEDNGGRYTGAQLGDEFDADFSYPNVGGSSTINEPDEANYEMSGSVALAGRSQLVVGFEVNVNIQNNQGADSELADLINSLTMPTPPAMEGDPVDTWTLGGLESGASEVDLTPGDGDDEETLINGISVEYVLLTRDAALFDDLSYRSAPPPLDDVELRLFVVREADAAGNLLFEAIGMIEQTFVTFFANGFEASVIER